MREKCPICGSNNLIKDWEMTFVVPDGWELPEKNEIYHCLDCDLIFYNNNKSQEDYNHYYSTKYGYDNSLSGKDAIIRLSELANLAMEMYPDKNSCIVDFGGGEGTIEKILKNNGYTNIYTVNPNDYFPLNADLIISSQVFEHLYDLHGTMQMLINHIKDEGRFLIEIPDTVAMMDAKSLPILDYHQKHISHFQSHTLDKLFYIYRYLPVYQYRCFEKSHFGYVYRAVYKKHNPVDVYYRSKEYVEKNVAEKLEKLKKIDFPVQIYGCGDICLHLLTKINLNIVGFTDNDPAYKNQTIMGIPVTTEILPDIPILVIAQNQQSSILKDINNKGLGNEVIII